jgi:hypothetical protein
MTTTSDEQPDRMPDGHPRYGLFKPDSIEYLGGGWWRMPSTGSNGSASFSCEYDCNPICGCHLASKCGSCNVCTDCDGCYCGEWD